MAQIKNIKKPGDLIRGASVGLAGLDKDGNVIGTGIDVEDIATWPEGAQSGDVLAWGGETGPEWRPQAGGSLYNHCIFARDKWSSATVFVSIEIITKSNTPFTPETLYSYFVDSGLDSGLSRKPATGYYINGSDRFPITSIFARNDGNFHLQSLTGDYYSALNDINDTVIEI